jgi:sugar phosphate isomerase/epimerase
VYVACSTLCFSKLSLEEALRTIRELQFPKADLAIHDPGPHLSPAEVATDVSRVAQRLKASNLPVAAFHLALTCTNPDEARRQLRAVCRLARVLTVPLLTVPAAPIGDDFEADVALLIVCVKV